MSQATDRAPPPEEHLDFPPDATPEERLEAVVSRLEKIAADTELHAKRLLVGDQMMRLLEGDNGMALSSLHAFAKHIGAQEQMEELAIYIEERVKTLADIRATLRRIEALPSMDEPTDPHIAS